MAESLPAVEIIISHRYDSLTDPLMLYWSIPFDINIKTSIGKKKKKKKKKKENDEEGGGVTSEPLTAISHCHYERYNHA